MRSVNWNLSAKWICSIASMFSVASLFAAEAPRRESYADRYGPISEHNIFAKERPIRRPTETTRPSNASQRGPDEGLVLRGVVLDNDGSVRAYVEDLNSGKLLKLAPGDSVGRGKIAAIDFDAVSYERNGETVWVDAGADFTGKQVVAITSDSTSSPTTGPAEVINPNDPNLTMEQKLKLRRQQERSK